MPRVVVDSDDEDEREFVSPHKAAAALPSSSTHGSTLHATAEHAGVLPSTTSTGDLQPITSGKAKSLTLSFRKALA